MLILLFLLALIIDFIIVSFLIEDDDPSPFWATIFIILGFAGYHFLVKQIDFWNLYNFIIENIGFTLGIIGAYIGIGLIWSFVRWYIYLLTIRSYREMATPEEIKLGRLKNIYYRSGKDIYLAIPTAADNKGQIIRWMSYWPFSMFGTFCRNLLVKLFSNLHKLFSGLFDKISINVFANEKLKPIEPITEPVVKATKKTKETL